MSAKTTILSREKFIFVTDLEDASVNVQFQN